MRAPAAPRLGKTDLNSATTARDDSRTLSRAASYLIGLGLVMALITWVGWKVLVAQFQTLGWVLLLLLILGLVKHLLRSAAWKLALDADSTPMSFTTLLGVRLSSQAIAYTTSMGLLVSEPLKPWMLRKTVAPERLVPPTIAEAGVYWFTSLIVTTLGTLIAVSLGASRRIAGLLLGISMLVSGFLVWVLMRRAPLLNGLVRLLNRRRLLTGKWRSYVCRGAQFEAQIRSFRIRYPKTTRSIWLYDLLVQVVMVGEVWLVLHSVNAEVGLPVILAIEAASRIAKVAGLALPARIGADEAGAAGAFLMLGLMPATGLTLALARRLQALLWTAVGFAWLAGSGSSPRQERTLSPSPGLLERKVGVTCKL